MVRPLSLCTSKNAADQRICAGQMRFSISYAFMPSESGELARPRTGSREATDAPGRSGYADRPPALLPRRLAYPPPRKRPGCAADDTPQLNHFQHVSASTAQSLLPAKGRLGARVAAVMRALPVGQYGGSLRTRTNILHVGQHDRNCPAHRSVLGCCATAAPGTAADPRLPGCHRAPVRPYDDAPPPAFGTPRCTRAWPAVRGVLVVGRHDHPRCTRVILRWRLRQLSSNLSVQGRSAYAACKIRWGWHQCRGVLSGAMHR